MDYQTASYLCHHGVPGMKWGVRKQRDRVSTSRADRKMARIDKRIDKRNAKIKKLSAKKHGTARYEKMNTLRTYNELDNANKNVISKKQAYKEAKGTAGEKRARNNLRNARLDRSLVNQKSISRSRGIELADSFGYGKSARGSYVRSREMGRGRVNSALRAMGKQTAIDLAVAAGTSAVVAGGKAAVKSYLKKKYGGTSYGQLPAYEVLKAKRVKVY